MVNGDDDISVGELIKRIEEVDGELASLRMVLQNLETLSGAGDKLQQDHAPPRLLISFEDIVREQEQHHLVFKPRLSAVLRKRAAARNEGLERDRNEFVEVYADWNRRLRRLEAAAGEKEMFAHPPESKPVISLLPASGGGGGGRVGRRATVSDAVRSEEELNQVLLTLLEQERDNPATRWMSTLAVIPPMHEALAKHIMANRFVDLNCLLPGTNFLSADDGNWTEQEQKTFVEKYLLHPKLFRKIASFLPFKTTADCVSFYYRNKKRLRLKQFVLNHRKGIATDTLKLKTGKRSVSSGESDADFARPSKRSKPVGRPPRSTLALASSVAFSMEDGEESVRISDDENDMEADNVSVTDEPLDNTRSDEPGTGKDPDEAAATSVAVNASIRILNLLNP